MEESKLRTEKERRNLGHREGIRGRKEGKEGEPSWRKWGRGRKGGIWDTTGQGMLGGILGTRNKMKEGRNEVK